MTAHILLIASPEQIRRQNGETLESFFLKSELAAEISLSLRKVSNPQTALQLMVDEPFDIAIADLALPRPGRGGAATLQAIREIRPDCRTILLTDHSGMEDLIEESADAVFFRTSGEDWLSAPELPTTLIRWLDPSQKRLEETQITPTLGRGNPVPDVPEGSLLVDKYRLLEIIGKGGMGVVHRAEDLFIGRSVAVKLLRLEGIERAQTVERRMRREVKIAGRLSHPRIVTLHDAGISEERIFLVMELVEGENLNQKLRYGPLPRGEALRVTDEILDALDHAHSKGVVHRDLKPANILFTRDGQAKIADFGVAKLVSLATGEESTLDLEESLLDSRPITLEGAMVGTLSYMAPEQVLGEADARADLYAAGLLLFEMLTGMRFAKAVKPLVRAAELTQRSEEPMPIPSVDDAALDRVLRRALAVQPEDRFATSLEFRQALSPFLEEDQEKGDRKKKNRKTGWQRFLPWSITFLCLLLFACGTEPTPTSQEELREFHMQLRGAPVTLDPVRTTSIYTLCVVDRLFDGLIRFDRPSGQAVPDLARRWEISDDGLEYLFTLREDASFHNGRGLVAEDIRYSWERLLAPETASPHVYLLENIVGAKAFHAGEKESVEGIEVLDTYLLRVRLEKPMPAFLLQLGVTPTVAVPREEVERLGEGFGRAPVGSGPFRFKHWPGEFRIELEAFAEHQEPPWIERLIFHVIPDADEAVRLFREGAIDLAPQVPADQVRALRRDLPAAVKVLPSIGWGGLGFRTDLPPFDDVRLRRAVSLALDRAELARRLGAASHTAKAGLIPPSVPGASEHPLVTDLEQARRLIAEADAQHGSEKEPLVYMARLGTEEVADFIVESLAAVGLEVRVEMHDFQTILNGVRDGRFRFFYFGWTGGFPDAEIYLRPLVHSRGGVNLTRYQDPEVDTWIDRATHEIDIDTRARLYRQAEEKALQDAPFVILYQWDEVFLLSERWTGIPLGLRAEYLEIEKARPAR